LKLNDLKDPSRSRIFRKIDFFFINRYIKVCRIRSQKVLDSDHRKSYLQLNRSREVLAHKRKQTEESQYYEEQKRCLYGLRIADLR